MINSVRICSNALMSLGDSGISSFTEQSPRSQICSQLYPSAKLAVLRSHPWSCATKRVILAPDAVIPAFGYSSQFTLPADWLRTLSVGAHTGKQDYRIEGRKILSYGNTCALLYIFDADESLWDSQLIEAMTSAMAARLAYPITKSTSLQQEKQQEYAQILKDARNTNGQEEPPQTFGDFPLIESRVLGIDACFGDRFDRFHSGS